MDTLEIARKLQEREEAMSRMLDKSSEDLSAIGSERTTEWIVDVLTDQINELYESLPAGKEIHLIIPGYGQIKPKEMLTDGSETLIIKGELENAGRVVIIQNISQINVCLKVADCKDPKGQSARIKIGFLK